MAEKTPTKAELQKHLDELEERLGEAEAKRDEYLADLQRLAADFDNYRKRAARDQQSLVTRAHERLVKDLLPVLDDLERALEAAAVHEALLAQPSDQEEGSVIDVVQKGYRLGDRVLRPARVVVAGARPGKA